MFQGGAIVDEIVRPGTIYVSTGQIGTADERAQDGKEVCTVLLFAWLDMSCKHTTLYTHA